MNGKIPRAAALAFAAAVLSVRAEAKPQWASGEDSNGPEGRRFLCEGSGASEADAYTAASSACNEKICRVCGVEIESVTETRETLKSVDFSHKVVERCRRVRKGEPKVRYKSVDCGPGGCTAWIDMLYTKDDEKAECPGYAQENFSDPAECEARIGEFSRVEGRAADDFRTRAALLDKALKSCRGIDIRQAPAMMALQAQLESGLARFEYSRRQDEEDRRGEWYAQRAAWTCYLPEDEDLHRGLVESKTLEDRLTLARDYVADRALVFDVLEVLKSGVRTPADAARLLAALKAAPAGKRYGSPDVRLSAVASLYQSEPDLRPVIEFARAAYPPETLDSEYAFPFSVVVGYQRKVAPADWDYFLRVHERRSCLPCLRTLIAAPDHGPGGEREKRLLQALSLPTRRPMPPERLFEELAPMQDPGFLLAVEPRLPADVRADWDWKFFYDVVTRFGRETPEADKKAFLARTVAYLKNAALDEGPKSSLRCLGLADALERLERAGAQTSSLNTRVCACLSGPLSAEGPGLVNKSDLEHWLEKRKASCP